MSATAGQARAKIFLWAACKSFTGAAEVGAPPKKAQNMRLTARNERR